MGFNAVSFYIDWALLEGKQGAFQADGVFALEPFFQAALDAGIYLIAVGTWNYKTRKYSLMGFRSVLDLISTPKYPVEGFQAGYNGSRVSFEHQLQTIYMLQTSETAFVSPQLNFC